MGKTGKHNIRKWCLIGLFAVGILCSLSRFVQKESLNEKKEKGGFTARLLAVQMERSYFELPGYLEAEEEKKSRGDLFGRLLLAGIPIYSYLPAEGQEAVFPDQNEMEQKEGMDEDQKNIDEDRLDYDKTALHIESSLLKEMEQENNLHNIEGQEQQEEEGENKQQGQEPEFVPAKLPAYSYDWEQPWDTEELITNFYAVDRSTELSEDYLDLSKLLDNRIKIDKEQEGPQILIYHTHASEAFADSVEGDPSTTIVGAGDKLTSLLQEQYGFRVLHHTGVYDSKREQAYSEALPALEQILSENPSIQVVIDLHRDAVSGDRKLVMDLQGRPTARFMFFNGLSYIRGSGPISYLENPYIENNLAFSFQAQVAANQYYPGIARKIYLKAYRYNQHLIPYSMLIELGAQNNTVEEIMNACDPLAHILSIVLDEGS